MTTMTTTTFTKPEDTSNLFEDFKPFKKCPAEPTNRLLDVEFQQDYMEWAQEGRINNVDATVYFIFDKNNDECSFLNDNGIKEWKEEMDFDDCQFIDRIEIHFCDEENCDRDDGE